MDNQDKASKLLPNSEVKTSGTRLDELSVCAYIFLCTLNIYYSLNTTVYLLGGKFDYKNERRPECVVPFFEAFLRSVNSFENTTPQKVKMYVQLFSALKDIVIASAFIDLILSVVFIFFMYEFFYKKMNFVIITLVTLFQRRFQSVAVPLLTNGYFRYYLVIFGCFSNSFFGFVIQGAFESGKICLTQRHDPSWLDSQLFVLFFINSCFRAVLFIYIIIASVLMFRYSDKLPYVSEELEKSSFERLVNEDLESIIRFSITEQEVIHEFEYFTVSIKVDTYINFSFIYSGRQIEYSDKVMLECQDFDSIREDLLTIYSNYEIVYPSRNHFLSPYLFYFFFSFAFISTAIGITLYVYMILYIQQIIIRVALGVSLCSPFVGYPIFRLIFRTSGSEQQVHPASSNRPIIANANNVEKESMFKASQAQQSEAGEKSVSELDKISRSSTKKGKNYKESSTFEQEAGGNDLFSEKSVPIVRNPKPKITSMTSTKAPVKRTRK